MATSSAAPLSPWAAWRKCPPDFGALEAALCGQPATAATFAEARSEASKLEALSDAYHTAAYRQRLAGIMVERALTQASKGAEDG